AIDRVLAVSSRRLTPPGPEGRVEVLRGGLGRDHVRTALAAAEVVINLAYVAEASSSRAGRSDNRVLIEQLLEAVVGAAVVVHVSSATVYGAWADNQVPLTERSDRRPNPGFAFAEHKVAAERVVEQWEADHPDATVAVLRPVAGVAEHHRSWLADQLLEASAVESAEHDPVWQVLHLDDLASAIEQVARAREPGPFNVAPDGWLTGEQRRALLPGRPRVRLPDPLVTSARRIRSSAGSLPDGIEPYLTYPWVVSNDRLRGIGWTPGWRNDEALVVAEDAPAWATLNARQRQYASLGALGALGAGAAAGVGWLVRRQR
ncbi:MAG: NAD-dependent epimerase/dehydratase family protein, partial [Actinomycetota bacterium]